MVMEDDAIVPPNFLENGNKIIQQSTTLKDPKRWDLWVIGAICEDLSRIPQEPLESGVVRAGAFVLAHCYIISLRAATRFLQDVYPIHCHIDFWMSIYCYLNDLRIVYTPNFRLTQAQVKTDIQNENGCAICQIPADYKSTHTLITNSELMLARGAEIACIGLIGYWLYQRFSN